MSAASEVRKVLFSEHAIDQLAAIEHERWAHWQEYVHSQCEPQADGSLVIPTELVARWEAQIRMQYSDLSAEERESDREQVMKYLPVIVDILV